MEGTSADGAHGSTAAPCGPFAQNGQQGCGRRGGPWPGGTDVGDSSHFRPRFFAPPHSHTFCMDFAVLATKAAKCISLPRTLSQAVSSARASTIRQKPQCRIQAPTSTGLTCLSCPPLLLLSTGENVLIQEKDEGPTGQAAPATPARTRPANCHPTRRCTSEPGRGRPAACRAGPPPVPCSLES